MGGKTHIVDNTGPVSATSGRFVGREREIEGLCEALDDACAGRGRLVMLAGEPGIGKTRLASEIEPFARQRGAQVLWGRCRESDGAPAFWPWMQVIRTYRSRDNHDALRTEPRSGAADVAGLVPQWLAGLPETTVLEAADAAAARFRLFDGVATFLRNAAIQQPLVVIVDDLHKADEASLRLLQYVATDLSGVRLLVIGSFRDTEVGPDHPLSRVLGDLASETQRIHLQGLSADDVGQLIETGLGRTASPLLATALHARTEGNPLFVTEFMHLIGADGHLEASEIVAAMIPTGVRDAVRLRCGRLSPDCQLALGTAAVIGRDFGVDVLRRVMGAECTTGFPARQLLDLLDEAVAAELVDAMPGMHGQYRFSHVLVRDTLYDDLASAQRVTLHHQIGQALEGCAPRSFYGPLPPALQRLPADMLVAAGCPPKLDASARSFPPRGNLEELHHEELDLHLATLAHHFGKAAAGGATDVVQAAIEYAVKAGEQAAMQLAYEEAALQYEAALQLLDSGDTGSRSSETTTRRRADLLIALGEAQGRAGELPKARTSLLEAARLARALGPAAGGPAGGVFSIDRSPLRLRSGQGWSLGTAKSDTLLAASELLARAALGCTALGDVDAGGDLGASSLLEEALAALSADDSAHRVRLLGRLAAELYYSPMSHERRRALSREAVEMAERLGDPLLLAIALCDTRYALLGPDNIEERRATADRIIELTERARFKERALDGHLWRLVDCLEMGDIAAVDIELHICSQRADELRRPFYLWRVAVLRAMRAHLEGRFDEADRLVHEALAAGQRAHSSNFFLIYALQLFQLRRDQGRLDEVEPAVREVADRYPMVPALRCGLASLYAELGREPEARAEFERLAAKNFGDLPRDAQWIAALDKLAQVCVFLGDAERAAVLYEMLLPFARHTVAISFGDACDGSVSRALGLLATLLERWDDAAQHFENALAMNLKLGARPAGARTQHAYAEMLWTRECGRHACNAEDRDLALNLLTRASATYEQLGMTGYLQQAIALRETIDHQASGSGNQNAEPRDQQREPSVFRRDGRKWHIVWHGRVFQVRHTKGLAVIAHLMQYPRRKFHVTELAAVAENLAMGMDRLSDLAVCSDQRERAIEATPAAGPEEQCEALKWREFWARVHALEDEEHRPGSAPAARGEIDRLKAQLRTPENVRDAERIRKRIGALLRTAYGRLALHDEDLRRHLANSVRPWGKELSYEADEDQSGYVGRSQ